MRERWKDGEPQVCEIVALMVAVAVRPECLSATEKRVGVARCLSSDAPLVSPIAALASRHEHAQFAPSLVPALGALDPGGEAGAVRIVVGEYRDALDPGITGKALMAPPAERPHRSPAGGADAHPGFEAFADAEAIGHLGVVIELDRGTADRAEHFFPEMPTAVGCEHDAMNAFRPIVADVAEESDEAGAKDRGTGLVLAEPAGAMEAQHAAGEVLESELPAFKVPLGQGPARILGLGPRLERGCDAIALVGIPTGRGRPRKRAKVAGLADAGPKAARLKDLRHRGLGAAGVAVTSTRPSRSRKLGKQFGHHGGHRARKPPPHDAAERACTEIASAVEMHARSPPRFEGTGLAEEADVLWER